MLSQIVVKVEMFLTIQVDVPEGADAAIGIAQTLDSLDIMSDDVALGELVERDITNWEIVTTTNLE